MNLTIDPEKGTYNSLTDILNEGEAMTLFHRLCDKFNWAGTVFTRGDIEESWDDSYDIPSIVAYGAFDDKAWDAIRTTWEWSNGVENILCEHGWDVLQGAINGAAASLRGSTSTLGPLDKLN